jgi:hypothetical protein
VDETIHVPAGGDRFQEHREVFGSRRIAYEVSTLDTNGGLFISRMVDMLIADRSPSRH